MAIITIRIDDDVKKDLTKFCHEIGISVGSLFNARARNLLRTKELSFMSDKDIKEIKKAEELSLDLEDAKEKSPVFNSVSTSE